VRSLEKDSFWARINEEKLAKDDIFKCLMAHFSTKVIGWSELSYCCGKFVFHMFHDIAVNLTEMSPVLLADGKEER